MSARDRYIEALLSHIRDDEYPSATQMQRVEAVLQRDELDDYIAVLVDKIENDQFPSPSLMKRIERLVNG